MLAPALAKSELCDHLPHHQVPVELHLTCGRSAAQTMARPQAAHRVVHDVEVNQVRARLGHRAPSSRGERSAERMLERAKRLSARVTSVHGPGETTTRGHRGDTISSEHRTQRRPLRIRVHITSQHGHKPASHKPALVITGRRAWCRGARVGLSARAPCCRRASTTSTPRAHRDRGRDEKGSYQMVATDGTPFERDPEFSFMPARASLIPSFRFFVQVHQT